MVSGLSELSNGSAQGDIVKGQPALVRQAVVVLAMHRTGSSAITRVLNLLGCDAAKTLIGPDSHNESGYWESDVLRVFNDKILASAGSNWRDWQAFNRSWYETPRFAEYLENGLELLQSEYGGSKFFVFKDPRVTRIVPFWRQLLAYAKIEPYVIITLRNPIEVAASLAKRDGMTQAEAFLIWLRNMLEAEHGSRGMHRVLVSHNRLMKAPSATITAIQKPLGLFWPRLTSNVVNEIDAFISPTLQHHKVDNLSDVKSTYMFSDWLRRVYNIFDRWSETGEDKADWPLLDTVREAMDSLTEPLGEVISVLNRKTSDIAAQNKELAYLRGEAGKRGDTVTALTAEKKALIETFEREKLQMRQEHSTEMARAIAEAENLRSKIAEVEKQSLSLSDQLSQAATSRLEQEQSFVAQITTLQSDLEATQAALDEGRAAQKSLQDNLSETQSALLQRRLEAEETATALNSTQHELEAAHKKLAQSQKERDEERQKHSTEMTRAIAEAENLRSKIAEVEKQSLSLSDQLSQAATSRLEQEQSFVAQITTLQSDLEATQAALDEGRAAQKSLQDNLSETQSALLQRRLEAEETATALNSTQHELEAAHKKLAQSQKERDEERAASKAAAEAALSAAKASETERCDEIADLVHTLMKREATIEAQAAQIYAIEAACAKQNVVLEEIQQKLDETISQYFHLAEDGHFLLARINQVIDAVLARKEPPWWGLKRKLAWKAELLRNSGMFNAEWYNNAYSDVAQSGQDPALHFILHGRAEGRHPLPHIAHFTNALLKKA